MKLKNKIGWKITKVLLRLGIITKKDANRFILAVLRDEGMKVIKYDN